MKKVSWFDKSNRITYILFLSLEKYFLILEKKT